MFKYSIFLSLILCNLAYAFGCRPKKAPSNTDSCVVMVHETDTLHTVELESGTILCVELAENPSTGFQWDLTIGDTTRIIQLIEPPIQNPIQPNERIVGAGVIRLYRFRALSPGETDIRLIYHRAWEKDIPPAKTFDLRAVIKP